MLRVDLEPVDFIIKKTWDSEHFRRPSGPNQGLAQVGFGEGRGQKRFSLATVFLIYRDSRKGTP